MRISNNRPTNRPRRQILACRGAIRHDIKVPRVATKITTIETTEGCACHLAAPQQNTPEPICSRGGSRILGKGVGGGWGVSCQLARVPVDGQGAWYKRKV